METDQEATIKHNTRIGKQVEAKKVYSEFGLREIFKDNHGTENLHCISFCPNPRPNIVAITAGNHLSVFDLSYRLQWVALHLKFVNGSLPKSTKQEDQIIAPTEQDVLSFSWVGQQSFKALAGTREGEIKRFQLQRDTRELKPFAEKHAESVTAIVGFMDGKFAVSLSKNNGEVRVWKFENSEACLQREIVKDAVWLTPSSDDQSVLIVCKSSVQALTVQEESGGCVKAKIDIILDKTKGANGRLEVGKSLSADEVVLVSVRGSVSVWSLLGKSRVAFWNSLEKTRSAGSFDLCRTTGVCVLGCEGGAIEIRDIYTGSLHKRIEHHRIKKITHIGIAKNGRYICAGAGVKYYKYSDKYNRKTLSPCEFVYH